MTKNELILKLKELQKSNDTETAHAEADDLILEYINDEEIKREYDAISKWYA